MALGLCGVSGPTVRSPVEAELGHYGGPNSFAGILFLGNVQMVIEYFDITIKLDISRISVDGGWDSWGHWGTCSVTCGVGTNLRHRSCNHPEPKHGGISCVGSPTSQKHCTHNDCRKQGFRLPLLRICFIKII
ncbi:SEM5A-like protein [Mya arenaria]|uniref:SEM5A-like protein n=1 Tax=Mya arenaria TaxID=6604 RepID=A0ABY7FKZ7_MYAAR|nr:SEM5A-like protein [Mya arenaria]